MNKKDLFDTSLADSQATSVHPLKISVFDISAYNEYEQQLLEKCRDFWERNNGVLVYRRMRDAEVFSHGCKNMQESWSGSLAH